MTDGPHLYLRRCNGHPAAGITVTRDTVESVLLLARAAQGATGVDIAGSLEAGLRICIPAGRPWEVELAGTSERTFTYVPLAAGQRRIPGGPA